MRTAESLPLYIFPKVVFVKYWFSASFATDFNKHRISLWLLQKATIHCMVLVTTLGHYS